MNKPILCLDFDGVIHSYTSGWQGADCIPNPPVEGAIKFIADAQLYFRVCIFSSRSHQDDGINAMQTWLRAAAKEHLTKGYEWLRKAMKNDPDLGTPEGLEAALDVKLSSFMNGIEWPEHKPSAFITIDDRAITFTGEWPDVHKLLDFKPWNKK